MRHYLKRGPLASALLAAGLALLPACSSSSTEPDSTADPDPPGSGVGDPLSETRRVPHGTPVIYLSTTQDASIFNDIIGAVIEGSLQNFVQLVPATGEAVLIDSNRSVSYAESRSTVRTFDDGLYIVNVSETGARLRRFDNEDLLGSPSADPIPTPLSFDSIEEDCFVVLGEDIVYKVAWREAAWPGTGFADGPLMRVSDFFDGGAELSTLDPGIGGDSPSPGGFQTDACFFHMDFADGVWYDARDRVERDAVQVVTRDPATGSVTSSVDALTNVASRWSGYALSNMAFDRGSVYYATLNATTRSLQIWGKEFGTPLWGSVAQADLSGVDATSIHGLDVDDGYVAVVVDAASDEDLVALWSPDSRTLELFSIGAPVTQLQVLYRAGDG